METEGLEQINPADQVRAAVAEQIGGLIIESRITGSRTLLTARVRLLVEAEARGDLSALRAANVDLGAAAGLWAAHLDLTLLNGSRR